MVATHVWFQETLLRYRGEKEVKPFAAAGSGGSLLDALSAGLESSSGAIVLFAPDDSLAFVSKTFADMFDIQPGARTFSDVMRHCYSQGKGLKFSTDIETWLAGADAKRRSTPHRAFEVDMVDGRWFWANETSFADGWILLMITEITALKSNEHILKIARDAAELAAGTDSLTGLANRRHAMSALPAAIAAAEAGGTPLSLVMIDLDHFKKINDRFGHDAGDRVLCHFAQTGRRVIRNTDLLARIGGEEFMLLMPGAAQAEALNATDRLRREVCASPSIDGLALTYTMSAGVAAYAGEPSDKFLQTADRALYRAKGAGRNRVEAA